MEEIKQTTDMPVAPVEQSLGFTPPKPSNVAGLLGKEPTTNDIFGVANAQQTLTQPAGQPVLPEQPINYADPMALYNQFMGDKSIVSANERLQALRNQSNGVNQALNTTTNALNNQNEQAMGGTGASINLIGGQVARARNLASSELSAIGENMSAEEAALSRIMQTQSDKFNIALDQRNKLESLIERTGGKAGIDYNMKFEDAMKKTAEYEIKVEKDKYKEELKREARRMGIKTSGKSTKDIEKSMGKSARKMSNIQEKMVELELKAKENSFRKSVGVTDRQNINWAELNPNKNKNSVSQRDVNLFGDIGKVVQNQAIASSGGSKKLFSLTNF